MKKNLLIISMLSCFNLVSGQQSKTNQVHSSSVCNVIALNNTVNVSDVSGGSKTKLSYNQEINTVTLIHNIICETDTSLHSNSGFVTYDISTNGGNFWVSNVQPIYGYLSSPTPTCSSYGAHPARDAMGMIYNPPGNTNYLNAHIAYSGRWQGNPAGKINGTGHLDLSLANENFETLTGHKWVIPEDIFTTKTGESWILTKLMDSISYADTLCLYKGIWNGNHFVYTYYPIQYLTNPDLGFTEANIAFADDGLTGYIALVTNKDIGNTFYQDTNYYIQVMKTSDGGQTWNCPIDLDIRSCLDAALAGQGFQHYMASWDLDIVVDMNNNPHIVNTVVQSAGAGSVWLENTYGTYGIFDFTSPDQGLTWNAQLIAHPQTYGGEIGPFTSATTEFNRPFISRSWDGSKLFYGHFSSDTSVYPWPFDNTLPNLYLIGYDVVTNKYTSDLSQFSSIDMGENITAGSFAYQKCTYGNGSYYCIDNGGTYSVPVAYTILGVNQNDPLAYFYIDCASPTGPFSYNGNLLPVTTAYHSPLCADGSGVVLSVQDFSDELIVSSNYPNPFFGKTSVDITLAKAEDVTLEIRNVIGQKLLSSTYKNQKAGLNTIKIDASALSHGLYFFTVRTGNNSFTKKMTIE